MRETDCVSLPQLNNKSPYTVHAATRAGPRMLQDKAVESCIHCVHNGPRLYMMNQNIPPRRSVTMAFSVRANVREMNDGVDICDYVLGLTS